MFGVKAVCDVWLWNPRRFDVSILGKVGLRNYVFQWYSNCVSPRTYSGTEGGRVKSGTTYNINVKRGKQS